MKSAFLLTLASLCLASSTFAVSTVAPIAPSVSAPAPTVVVSPKDLPFDFRPTVVNVEFKLDAEGRPRDVRLPFVADARLRTAVVKAFRQWKFSASDVVTAQDKAFVLPLEIRLDEP